MELVVTLGNNRNLRIAQETIGGLIDSKPNITSLLGYTVFPKNT
jgi:hypothetical protein